MVVAKLVERSYPTPEVHRGSNPVVGKLLYRTFVCCQLLRKDENKEKEAGMALFKKDKFKLVALCRTLCLVCLSWILRRNGPAAVSFCRKNGRRQWDLNSDRRMEGIASWPIDQFHCQLGPTDLKCLMTLTISNCVLAQIDCVWKICFCFALFYFPVKTLFK